MNPVNQAIELEFLNSFAFPDPPPGEKVYVTKTKLIYVTKSGNEYVTKD